MHAHSGHQAALLTLALSFATLPALAADRTAVQCGDTFDAAAGKLIGAHTVVVENGQIRELLKGIQAPEGAELVDLSGHTCSPGWIDMHVHLRGQSNPQSYSEGFRLNPQDFAYRSVGYAEKTLLAGFTTVRDLGGDITLSLRDAINQGLVRGPRIFAAGKSIATTGGHGDPSNGLNTQLAHLVGPPGPTEGVINSPEQARQAVRQRYKDGSDVIKITATGGVLSYAKSADAPQFTLDEVAEVVRTARDYGYKVAAHAHGKEGMKRAILAGVDSIEHGTYMDEEIFKLMKEKGTWYVPTVSAGKFVGRMAAIDGYYPAIVRPKAAAVGAQIADTFAAAHKAGVKIAFGTDAGVSFHGDNAEEFVFMVEGGMSPAEALRTATVHAAELLGESERLGTLEPGKFADIVAVPGNPLTDVSLTRAVSFVMKQGEIHKRP